MTATITLPYVVGRYTLTRQIGQGGMGVVYAARDERLERDVAVKMIAGLSSDTAVQRFWREARAAASVSHPNVCQVFEVDECSDGIYLAMELLQGESLDARLARGPCAPREAVDTALQILAALSALHERGLVHRDIKPSNVYLTPHGIKVLDFGLARPIIADTLALDVTAPNDITQPGMVVGTPRYMAPEQLTGGVVDGRADIHAVGALLFEMLAGRALFAGDNMVDLARAIVHDHPPALRGPAAVVAVDRVIRRALAKDTNARFPVADAMAAELSEIAFNESDTRSIAAVSALLRIVVPPLRLQSADADIGFLSYGLAETVSGSLASLRDVAVRSPSVAARWASADADIRRLAMDADVDVIVAGSLTRMGDQLRVSVQLVDAQSGTVAGGTSVRGKLSGIFEFEDELTRAVLSLLTPMRAGSSSGAERRDVPANARAFELFLRGLELARQMPTVTEARDCFAAALEEDPAFAPAWAWLGRCHRVIGKYLELAEENDRRAEEAFQRALALSPELPLAHRFYTHFESEHGRADAAIGRLLRHSKTNRNDAQLFAGLVHACRYAGLLDESLAAYEEARRLDPMVNTSVEFTLLQRGDIAALDQLPSSVELEGVRAYQLMFWERTDEIPRRLTPAVVESHLPGYRGVLEALRDATLRPDHVGELLDNTLMLGVGNDPEALLLAGGIFAALGAGERAIGLFSRAMELGFFSTRLLEVAPAFATLRSRKELQALMEKARQRQLIARAVFDRGGGRELLGLKQGRAR